MYKQILYITICVLLILPSVNCADYIGYSPLIWEEHFFVTDTGDSFSIIMISFSIQNNSDNHKLDIIFPGPTNIQPILYPSIDIYPEIECITISKSERYPSQSLITVTFTDAIHEFNIYSFGIFVLRPDFTKIESPLLPQGKTQWIFDNTILLEDKVYPIDNTVEVIAGEKTFIDFPRVTLTIPTNIKIEISSPSNDAIVNGIPYSLGLTMEKTNGKYVRVVTDFESYIGGETSYPSKELKQGESMIITSELRMFPIDPFIENKIQYIFSNIDNYKTYDWIEPPSHIYLEGYTETSLLNDILIIITIFGFISSIILWCNKKRVTIPD